MNKQQKIISDIKNDRMSDATRLFEEMMKERALQAVVARRKIVAQQMFNKVINNGS